ncbi:response regulator transcription factor [Vibrio albus]|uniref:response regulator transcription factor n=1 Tax=Vibrio albus TaxID=2200953 RepID=UPI0015E85FFC|nr:response regulator transcription factor [Vibrio albus]
MPAIYLPLFCLHSLAGYMSELPIGYGKNITYIEHVEQIKDQLPMDTESLVLLDFTSASEQPYQLEELGLNHPKCQLIVLNAPQNLRTSQLLKLGKIKGLFYQNMSASEVALGIEHILKGQLFLPDQVMKQLLDYYQSVMIRHGKPHQHNLTPREMDVLRLLRSGASNTRLADELFISEHTIKSHLYKIFRKLNIKNRNQAIEWAYKFLP